MSTVTIILFLLILLGTYMIGAVAAYGSNLLALPLLLYLFHDVDTAVAVLLITGTIQAAHLAFLNRSHINTRKLLVILGVCLTGAPVGFWGSGILPERELMIFVGLVLLVSGAIPLLWAVILKIPKPLCAALLVLGGIIHGAFGTGGGPVVLAARSMIQDKLVFRATLFYLWLIFNFIMAMSRGLAGRIDSEMLLLSLMALPVLFIGNCLGQKIALRLSGSSFDRLVGLVLIVAGVITIVQAI